MRLWDGPAPGSEAWDHEEVPLDSVPDAPGAVRNVVVPTLTPHPAAGAAGPDDRAVIVVPGGAFHLLSMENEGHDVARALAARGYDAWVLKYRVVPTPADEAEFGAALADAFVNGMEAAIAPYLPLAIADTRRAVDLVRAAGAAHVTVVGFSAGASLAAAVAEVGPDGTRPDAVAAIYVPPVSADAAPPDAPPLFVAVAADDAITGIEGSLRLHDLWRAAGRPVEVHVYEQGGHGFGMLQRGLPVDGWFESFVAWLGSRQVEA